MTTPWSKELDQNVIKLFNSIFESLLSKNINSILNFVGSLLDFFFRLHLIIWNHNDITCLLSESQDYQKAENNKFVHIFF